MEKEKQLVERQVGGLDDRGIVVRCPSGARDVSLFKSERHVSGAHSSLLSMATGEYFPRDKVNGVCD
jgi:hypothetical protein